ncbi:hypothetical protein [Clostridium perfringens]|uniref:hypothetical protein n=1 Tax=Clostridium perfringens TaxID=1502 RepID=UPI00096A42DC|nr:hypothetical protein [Clostridium perfringens]
MDKELLDKTEERVRIYYRKDAIIGGLKEKIKFLENSIAIIEAKIENNHFNIPSNLKSIEFSERVQSSCSGSPIEQSMIRIYEGYEKKIARNLEEINRLENLIDDIEEDYKIIEFNIEKLLGEYHKKFLEDAYKENLPNWKLANKYHMSEVSCTRKKRTLMKQVIKWEKEMLSEIS